MAGYASEADLQIVEAKGNPNAADSRHWVTVREGAIQDAEASKSAGRPIYRDQPFITIRVPGDKDNVVDRPVWDDPSHMMSDTSRFAQQWARYKAGKQDDIGTGTPLSMWPPINKAQVEELAYLKVKTVEQLAGVSDGNLQKMGPGYLELRKRAVDFLEAAKGSAHVDAMRGELEKRDSDIAALRAQLAQLGEEFSKQKQGQGRK
ncbi:MAG: hypothetical protein NVS1B16_07180 [Pseudarthrobacter sp.]